MQPDLQAALHYCRNLPSPPGVALRIIELAQDPDVDMTTTAKVIGMDMALSARMLRVANSPLYASRRRIDNLGQALTMLGLNATLSLALGFSMVHGVRSTFIAHPCMSASGDAPAYARWPVASSARPTASASPKN